LGGGFLARAGAHDADDWRPAETEGDAIADLHRGSHGWGWSLSPRSVAKSSGIRQNPGCGWERASFRVIIAATPKRGPLLGRKRTANGSVRSTGRQGVAGPAPATAPTEAEAGPRTVPCAGARRRGSGAGGPHIDDPEVGRHPGPRGLAARHL